MKASTAMLGTIATVAVVLFASPVSADESLVQADVVFDAAVSEDMLADQRGKALITNTNDLDAAVYKNSVVDAVTGSNFVSEGSLANNAGLATMIQNSGNNVLIQNALILNIQTQ